MMQTWIDAHCHLGPRFYPEGLPSLALQLKQAACRGLVLGGVDAEEWLQQEQVSLPNITIARAFGLHPWTVQDSSEAQLEVSFKILEKNIQKAAACGELGLDFHRAQSEVDRNKQKKWFKIQLELALKERKPCILHIVKSHPEALYLLRPYAGKISGLVHSFWADASIAKTWLEHGFVLSLPPRLLRSDPHGLLKNLPRERLLFESDSPELRPERIVTTPLLALELMQHAARKWGEPLEQVICRQNICLENLFPILRQKPA